ncbi:O-antigen ligase family protein [Sphingomonas sp. 1P06PA]|uniref:O-antigen ligase family protein n=1 Tax=Sphingomonas sp. 1P06PA TaxID=554121 RepID=UPI0039A49205
MVTMLGDLGHIRVADAPPTDVRPAMAAPSGATHDGSDASPLMTHATGLRAFAYAGLLGWVVMMFSNYLFLEGQPIAIDIRVYVRYLMWPAILLAAALHFARPTPSTAGRAMGMVMPYFIVGVIAGAVGVWPIGAARSLIFWLFGVLAAAVIGAELSQRTMLRFLFWLYAIMIATSIAAAVALPEIGTMADGRAILGDAWRGLFNSKNTVGPICLFGALWAVLAPDLRLIVRLAGVALAIVLVVFSNAQSAWLSMIALAGYLGVVLGLRRFSMPAGAKALILIVGIAAGIGAVIAGLQPLLEALGRDPTLTGRTTIWSTWLDRALDHPVLGTGPGSFTELSITTIDLTISQLYLGRITSPHNMFIAIFGETGAIGLLVFLVTVGRVAFLLPFSSDRREALVAGSVAFSMFALGFAETREVFSLGLNMVFLVATYAGYLSATAAGRDTEGLPQPAPAPINLKPELQPANGPRLLG